MNKSTDKGSTDSGISIQEIPAELLMALLDNPYESLILVDAEGIIRFMSSSNEGIYPIPVKDAVGRHITEVSADTRMPRILQTRKAEIGRSMVLKNQHRVVARIPLLRDGRVVGAAGKLMFMSPEKLKELYGRIEALKNNLDFYKETLNQVYGSRYTFENIIGNSAPSLKAKALARQAAESDSPVLIVGESGTGKELFAHAIHQISRRRNHNFVKVNSASIPGELIESELFGYEPGAFTGARKQGKPGKFELAQHGTIFLDEIGDMPSLLQVKLMRVLQEKEIERIGGKPRQIDFRVISATNLDLETMVRQKTFRLDLFYRLNVIIISLPPLRDIREDILSIFNHFLNQLSAENHRMIHAISPEAAEALQDYSWPGNIRELRNVAERALIVCKGEQIELDDLPMSVKVKLPESPPINDSPDSSLKALIENAERAAILQALKATGYNRNMSAALLKIHRTGLYQKMKKYQIP